MSVWRCQSCGALFGGQTFCPVCAGAGERVEMETTGTIPRITVSGDMRAETAIQALLLAVEAMRAQIQAQAVRITILEEKLDP